MLMNGKIIQRNILITITVVTVVLVSFILLPICGDNTSYLVNSPKFDVSEYFVDADGNAADPGSIPHGEYDYYLQHTMPEGMALCFQSKSVNFEIYDGSELIYRYDPEIPKFYGRGYGKMYHYVTLSHTNRETMPEIRIHTQSASKDGKSYIKDICYADPADYMAEQLFHNMPNFLICFFIFLLGFLLICGGMALKPDDSGDYIESDQKRRLGIISMGAFALCASAWSGTETDGGRRTRAEHTWFTGTPWRSRRRS